MPEIAGLLARHGAVFHCDAAQAACVLDTSPIVKHADLIGLSGHKIYGPRGIGALYIRKNLHSSIEPMIYGGGQQNGLRSGTVPVPLSVGMVTAAEIGLVGQLLSHIEALEARILELEGPRKPPTDGVKERKPLFWVKANRPARPKKERRKRSHGFARRRDEPTHRVEHASLQGGSHEIGSIE